MSQRAVERTLGKLVTDEGFRDEFFAHPETTCLRAGLDLAREEMEALFRVSRAALAALCAHLDDRICRLHVTTEATDKEVPQ